MQKHIHKSHRHILSKLIEPSVVAHYSRGGAPEAFGSFQKASIHTHSAKLLLGERQTTALLLNTQTRTLSIYVVHKDAEQQGEN